MLRPPPARRDRGGPCHCRPLEMRQSRKKGMATGLVVGAQGCLGSFVAKEFARQGWTVLRAGRRPDSSTDFRHIDLDEPLTWNAALADVDLVVSTVPHPGLPLERHVLETGGLCLSAATVPRSALRRLDIPPRDVRGTVVPHIGLTPGLSNLLAEDLLRLHPRASEIDIGLTFAASGASGEEGREWVFRHFAEAETSLRRPVPLPPPIHTRACVWTSLVDEGWLPNEHSPPVQRLEFCMIEKSVDALLRGLASAHLMALFARIYAPSYRRRLPSPTHEQIYQWASVREPSGTEHGWLISARGDYRSTAIAIVLFAESLWRRAGNSELPRGLRRIQDVFTLRQMKDDFAQRGIEVHRWARV